VKNAVAFIGRCVLAGLLVILPIYLALLLLLKGIASAGQLVRPFTQLLPESLPAQQILSALLVLVICFAIGLAVRTRLGRLARGRLERSVFERIPGYELLRSLTLQVAGEKNDGIWKPALVEIEEALVPGFIIEAFEDGRYTVFVPSVPTPFAGAVYVLDAHRVHPVDVPFTEAVKVITKWGSGARGLVQAMEAARGREPPPGGGSA
jgi:uncharacterized membrane protein